MHIFKDSLFQIINFSLIKEKLMLNYLWHLLFLLELKLIEELMDSDLFRSSIFSVFHELICQIYIFSIFIRAVSLIY